MPDQVILKTKSQTKPEILGSCKKDNDDSGAYKMKFKANGTLIEFTVQGSLTASFSQSGSVNNGVFTGYDANSNMGLQVYDSKAFEESTYSGYVWTGSAFVGALMGYSDKTGTLYTQGTTNSNATINIIEITSTTVRGTFNGTVKADGKPDISITEGEFFVWRTN